MRRVTSRFPYLYRETSKVHCGHGEGVRFVNHRDGTPFSNREIRAQDFVATNDCGQALHENVVAELPFSVERSTHVIEGIARFQFVEKPESLLCEGYDRFGISWNRHDLH